MSMALQQGQAGPARGMPRRPLRADRRGMAVLEITLIAPVALLLMVGIIDIGMAMRVQSEVRNAARAGVQYVLINGYNQTNMQTAATSATPLSVSATASTFTGCPNTTGITHQASGTCTAYSNSALANYAQIVVTASYTRILPYSWASTALSFSATMVTRY